jgi:hypothetical protein
VHTYLLPHRLNESHWFDFCHKCSAFAEQTASFAC